MHPELIYISKNEQYFYLKIEDTSIKNQGGMQIFITNVNWLFEKTYVFPTMTYSEKDGILVTFHCCHYNETS